jgi:geranylgeranylglycerol-phosphate geranylgeranyltransferase
MSGRIVAHLEMWRPYTLCYVGLVGLSGALLAAPGAPGIRLLGAWSAPTLGWLAGLYGGDYRDRHLDAIAKVHRPIPSGRVRPGVALGAMIFCVATGGAIALALNWRTVLLVVIALSGGIAYSAWLKGSGLAGNLVRGMLTASAFLFGTMTVVPWPPLRLLPVAALWLMQDSGSNLVGTLRDTVGDRSGGYRTLVVQRGERAALACIAVLYGLAAGLAVWALVTLPSSGRWVAVALAALALALACTAAVTLVGAEQPIARRTALRAHELLVIERVILAGAMVALAAQQLALLLTGVLVAITAVSQRMMRERYEFGRRPAVAGVAEEVPYGSARPN